MCGRQFESLFPALGHLRPRQADRLDDVARGGRPAPAGNRPVLEGVPDDLARVIQRMVAKDPASGTATAQEALRDLRPRQLAMTMGDDNQPPPQTPPPKRRKRLVIAASSLAMIVTVILAVIFLRPAPAASI